MPVIPATAFEIAVAPPEVLVGVFVPEPDPVPVIGPLMEVGDFDGLGTTTAPFLVSTKIGGFKPLEKPPELLAEATGPAKPKEVINDLFTAAWAPTEETPVNIKIRAKNTGNLIFGRPKLALLRGAVIFFMAPCTAQGRTVCAKCRGEMREILTDSVGDNPRHA